MTFYADVLPALEKRCISCHSPGGVGSIRLINYEEVRSKAGAIAEAVKSRRMPPWYANPNDGPFANSARLTDDEIRMFDTWASAGAPPGKPPKQVWTGRVRSEDVSLDLLLTGPSPLSVPANGEANYYLIFPLPFTYDRWIRGADIRPGNRTLVDRAILYIREPKSQWLRNVTPGAPQAVSDTETEAQERIASASIAAVYAPGASSLVSTEGIGRRIPAGSDLVLQIHYRNSGAATTDQPQVGLLFAGEYPAKRIVTLRMARDNLKIPAGEAQFQTTVAGTLTDDALLVSLLPRLDPRGGAIELEVVSPNGTSETLLKVEPNLLDLDFEYIFQRPRLIPRGSMLRWTGSFKGQPKHGEGAGIVAFLEMAVDPALEGKPLLAP